MALSATLPLHRSRFAPLDRACLRGACRAAMDRHTFDASGGYDALAREFMLRRDAAIGVATVRQWARELPSGGAVLDLGCGHGVPISQALIEDGFRVYGVDVSPAMAAALRERFPQAHIACEAAEHSSFFGRRFDGVLAWGLLFLLEAAAQVALIRRVASALEPGGRFLFTSPEQACTWTDVLTGRESVSLGTEIYRATLAAAGLALVEARIKLTLLYPSSVTQNLEPVSFLPGTHYVALHMMFFAIILLIICFDLWKKRSIP